MHLFTITASLQVHCSLSIALLFAGVAAAEEEQEEIVLHPGRLAEWLTNDRSVRLSVHLSVNCIATLGANLSPVFELSPGRMGDTAFLRTHSTQDGVQQARMRHKLWLAWG